MGVLNAAIRHVAFPNGDVGSPHRQLHAGVRLTQLLLGQPEVGDVGAGAEPFDDLAGAVSNWYAARLEPAVLPVRPADPEFHVVVRPTRNRLRPAASGPLPVIGVKRLHPPPADMLGGRDAGILLPLGTEVVAVS